jgi:predicted amidophosphoribosyltransferase
MCDRCEKTIPEFGPDLSQQTGHQDNACLYCKKSLDQTFKYCPYCGKQI